MKTFLLVIVGFVVAVVASVLLPFVGLVLYGMVLPGGPWTFHAVIPALYLITFGGYLKFSRVRNLIVPGLIFLSFGLAEWVWYGM